MHNFRKLDVWQDAIELAIQAYEATDLFPDHERFSLTTQIRRSAVSIPSNIAEGAGRNTNKEFNHFLGISNGSSCELETQLIIANRRAYLKEDAFLQLLHHIARVQKQNYNLGKSLLIK